MLQSFIFWLSVLAVLIAYLCVSVGRRWVAEEAKRRSAENRSPGTAFDASTIAPRLQRVRLDHLAAAEARPQHDSYRHGLLAIARRVVANLPYFHRANHEHEVQGHGG